MSEENTPIPKIRKLREARDLTQRELAEKVGVTVTTIANWEQGRRGLEEIRRVRKLCKALNCQVEDLLEEKEEPTLEQLLEFWNSSKKRKS